MTDAAKTFDAPQEREPISRNSSYSSFLGWEGQDKTSQDAHPGPFSGPSVGDPSSAHGHMPPPGGSFADPSFSGPNPFAPPNYGPNPNYGSNPNYPYYDPYGIHHPAAYPNPYMGYGVQEAENVDGYKPPPNPFQTQEYPATADRSNRPFWLNEPDMSAEKKAVIPYPLYPNQGYGYYGAHQAHYGLQPYYPQQYSYPLYPSQSGAPWDNAGPGGLPASQNVPLTLHSVTDQKGAVDENHDVVWHPSAERDVTVHLEVDIEKDIDSCVDEFLRLKRMGHYKDAEEFFQLHLLDDANYLPVTVEHADMLLRQGAYKKLLETVDDEEVLDLCGAMSTGELRGTTGEEVSLLLIASLARSERIPNISMAAEALSIASKFMETRNMARLTSIEVQIYCHCLELGEHISQGSNLDISLQKTVLNGPAGSKTLKLKELYKILVREKRIWDLRDLVVAISTSAGPYVACETLVGVRSPSRAITMFIQDWESIKYDKLGISALLDILTCICTHIVDRGQQNEDQAIILEEEVVFEQTGLVAESLQDQNLSEIQTRSYLEWIIMKEKRIRVLESLLHGKDEKQKNSSASPLGHSQNPSITLLVDSLPIYIPVFPSEQFKTSVSEEIVKKLSEEALRSVLTASTKLGAYETQSACYQELIQRVQDPTDLFMALESLEGSIKGSPLGLLTSRLSRYSYVDSETKAEKLGHDLLELDPRLWKDFEHPLLEWAYWRVRWAVDKTTGRDRVWESSWDWKAKLSEDEELPDEVFQKLEKLGITSSARKRTSLPTTRRGRANKNRHKSVNLGGTGSKDQGSKDKVQASFVPEAQRSGNEQLWNRFIAPRPGIGKPAQHDTFKDRQEAVPQQTSTAETNTKGNEKKAENEEMKKLQRQKEELEKKLKASAEEKASLETNMREKLFGEWMKQKQEMDREIAAIEKLRHEAFQAKKEADASRKQSEQELIARVKAVTEAEVEAAKKAEEERKRRHAEETARLERLLQEKLEAERRRKLELDAMAVYDKARAEREEAMFRQKIVEEARIAAEKEMNQKLELKRAKLERDMSQQQAKQQAEEIKRLQAADSELREKQANQQAEEIKRLQAADSELREKFAQLPLTRDDKRAASDRSDEEVEVIEERYSLPRRWKGKGKEREREIVERRRRSRSRSRRSSNDDSVTTDTEIIRVSRLSRIAGKISNMWQSVRRRRTGSFSSGYTSETRSLPDD
ncbi:hypothetical protein L207DRAFT_511256 [Hyaloscypha variabilis F]|uniref:Uncharacterized protein n=1 Tax=Hyaloscypha variabilis (strain UAMH 11265 / GT02V1 / F) TaxID=1149755 RepID=A0A2J6RSD2_HYAVF|nr:hypothetical protein L207DRAFT_511256 [Hyaloscypha variabilis F]